MKFQTIQRSTAPEMVVEQILNSLKTGELKPGEKLPSERNLAIMFGVGRSSVREATKALIVMGCLEAHQGKGTFVSEDFLDRGQSASEFLEALEAVTIFNLMEAREILECRAIELATKRADQKYIERLKLAVEALEDCGDDKKRFYEADLAFHFALAEGTNNLVITELMKLLVRKVHRYHSKFMATTSETYEKTIATANQILASIISGNGEKAADCMRDHLNVVNAALQDVISEGQTSN